MAKKIMVEVEISGAEEKFLIRRDLLCSKSTFFKAALKGDFMEAKDNSSCLSNASIFSKFSTIGSSTAIWTSWTVETISPQRRTP